MTLARFGEKLDLFCCDECMEIGVIVHSTEHGSTVDVYEEVQDESGNIYFRRRSKRL